MRRCWNRHRSAPRCCRPARSNWPWCTRCRCRCARASSRRTRRSRTGRTAPAPAHIVCDEDKIVEQHVVSGIAYSRDEAKVSIRGVQGPPGRVGGNFRAAGRGRYQRRHDRAERVARRRDGEHHLHPGPQGSAQGARGARGGAKDKIGYAELSHSADVAKVSVVGIGMRSHAGVAAKMFKALAEKGINIQAITTSEIKVSRADRRGLYRARGAGAAQRLRPRCGVRRRAMRTIAEIQFAKAAENGQRRSAEDAR